MDKANLTEYIKNLAAPFGYEYCEIISIDSINDTFKERIEDRAKTLPEMAAAIRLENALLVKGEDLSEYKSIIVGIRPYGIYKIPENLDKYFGKVYLFDGRLSYSREEWNRLNFESALVDLGLKIKKVEIPARLAAQKAGLAWFGKNNFAYTEKYGSWIWIDTWLVDKELDFSVLPEIECKCPDGCDLCMKACPTSALCGPFCLNKHKCIALLSFGSRQPPDEPTQKQMGTWLYGCDVCQNVCPQNRKKWQELVDFPKINELAEFFSPEAIRNMSQDEYEDKIQKLFWYISEDDLWLWKHNAERAIKNSKRAE